MAKLNVTRPTALLGRRVCGSYFCGGDRYTFDGVVEAVILPAPGSGHQVEFYVAGEYVTLADCDRLDYVRRSAVLPEGQLGAKGV
jgi:hypothetical protein